MINDWRVVFVCELPASRDIPINQIVIFKTQVFVKKRFRGAGFGFG